MILIFGGTTEGRIAIQTLEEAGKTFYYSTKGDEQDVLLHNGIRLQGAMDAIEIETFCAQHHIKLLIDAAHPFATQLHETLEQVSVESNIPVIRFERIFPERDEEHITWCRDYDDAIEKIQKEKIFILLALTGVQTIGKLKPLWQNACCYFRILDRDSSRKLAREQGFSEKNLYYYTPGEDEQILMKQLHPEAILLKESGISGGFCEKVEAARQLGIRIFAIRRPETSGKFICVNGEHGLRRIVEKHLPDFFPLRSGLTTGTCAALAVAATRMYSISTSKASYGISGSSSPAEKPSGVPVEPQHHIPTPTFWKTVTACSGQALPSSESAKRRPGHRNGMKVVANIAIPFRIDDPLPEDTPQDDYNVIVGGEGVGVSSPMPGLGLELGSSAINDTTRNDGRRTIALWLNASILPNSPIYSHYHLHPRWRRNSQRTFNPRPASGEAFPLSGLPGIVNHSPRKPSNSIRKSMEVAKATQSLVSSSAPGKERTLHQGVLSRPPHPGFRALRQLYRNS